MIEYFYIITTQSPAGNLNTYTGVITTPETCNKAEIFQAISQRHYGLPGGIIHYHVEPN